MGWPAFRPRRWWARRRADAARGARHVRAHAVAQWHLGRGAWRPWRRVIRDGAVFAERRRPDGSVADRLTWAEYCAVRQRHRRLTDGTRALVQRHRWRWLARALFGWV